MTRATRPQIGKLPSFATEGEWAATGRKRPWVVRRWDRLSRADRVALLAWSLPFIGLALGFVWLWWTR